MLEAKSCIKLPISCGEWVDQALDAPGIALASILYLAGGLLVGLFIGYQVLPSLLPQKNAPLPSAELQAALTVQEQLETKLAANILTLDGIADARVQLSTPLSGARRMHRKASVVIAPTGDALSDAQLATIAELVASGIDGLAANGITIFDFAGNTLNLHAVQQYERQRFWTDIAINISKILGIIAALITVRYIIQAIHKSVLGDDPVC